MIVRWARTKGIIVLCIFFTFWFTLYVAKITTNYQINPTNIDDEEIIEETIQETSELLNSQQVNISDNMCQEISNINKRLNKIVYSFAQVKVYKAASSTLANILYRYGYYRELNFFLPTKENQHQIFPDSPASTEYQIFPICSKTEVKILNNNTTSTRDVIKSNSYSDVLQGVSTEKYNILNIHAKINTRKTLYKVMPNDTIILGSFRQPKEQLKSAFRYNGFERRLKDYKIDFKTFMKSPTKITIKYLLKKQKRLFYEEKDWGLWNSQSQLFGIEDFGITPGITKGDLLNNRDQMGRVNQFLKRADEIVDFAIIAEEFDSSLIVMKNTLGLEYSDIVYFANNQMSRSSTPQKKETEGKLEELVTEWNYVDHLLYQRMKTKLNTAIKSIGEDLVRTEVQVLRAYNEQLAKFCLNKVNRYNMNTALGIEMLYFALSNDGLTNQCCLDLTYQEWNYIPRLKNYMLDKCSSV